MHHGSIEDHARDLRALQGRTDRQHITAEYVPEVISCHVMLEAALLDVMRTGLRIFDGHGNRTKEEQKPAIWYFKLSSSCSPQDFHDRLMFAAHLVRKHWCQRNKRHLQPTADGGLRLGPRCSNSLVVLMWHQAAPGRLKIKPFFGDISILLAKSRFVSWLTKPVSKIFERLVEHSFPLIVAFCFLTCALYCVRSLQHQPVGPGHLVGSIPYLTLLHGGPDGLGKIYMEMCSTIEPFARTKTKNCHAECCCRSSNTMQHPKKKSKTKNSRPIGLYSIFMPKGRKPLHAVRNHRVDLTG